MNAQDMLNDVRLSFPDLDDYELLGALNDAQTEVWERLVETDSSYYEDIKTNTLSVAGAELDLPSLIHPRLYQVNKIRVQGPSAQAWSVAIPTDDMASGWVSQQSPVTQVNAEGGPYRYRIYGKGTVQFAQPLAVGSVIEVTYIFSPIPLAKTVVGTVSSSGTAVTGTGTVFKSILLPDEQAYLPGTDFQAQIGAEIVVAGSPYKVSTISTDTALVTAVAIAPAASGSEFTLATASDLPHPHHRIVVAIVIRDLHADQSGVESDDYLKWSNTVTRGLDALVKTAGLRQNQQFPRKKPFRFQRNSRSQIVIT